MPGECSESDAEPTMLANKSSTYLWTVALLAPLALLGMLYVFPSIFTASDAWLAARALTSVAATMAVLVLLVRVGGEAPSALGIVVPRASALGWGLVGFVVAEIAANGTNIMLQHWGYLQSSQAEMTLADHPIWVLSLIALGAAVSEEITFRSVMISHIGAATGRQWIGAVLSLVVFSFAHAPFFGLAYMLSAGVAGLTLTLLFLWKRNLWICIITHFFTDAAGLLFIHMSLHNR